MIVPCRNLRHPREPARGIPAPMPNLLGAASPACLPDDETTTRRRRRPAPSCRESRSGGAARGPRGPSGRLDRFRTPEQRRPVSHAGMAMFRFQSVQPCSMLLPPRPPEPFVTRPRSPTWPLARDLFYPQDIVLVQQIDTTDRTHMEVHRHLHGNVRNLLNNLDA